MPKAPFTTVHPVICTFFSTIPLIYTEHSAVFVSHWSSILVFALLKQLIVSHHLVLFKSCGSGSPHQNVLEPNHAVHWQRFYLDLFAEYSVQQLIRNPDSYLVLGSPRRHSQQTSLFQQYSMSTVHTSSYQLWSIMKPTVPRGTNTRNGAPREDEGHAEPHHFHLLSTDRPKLEDNRTSLNSLLDKNLTRTCGHLCACTGASPNRTPSRSSTRMLLNEKKKRISNSCRSNLTFEAHQQFAKSLGCKSYKTELLILPQSPSVDAHLIWICISRCRGSSFVTHPGLGRVVQMTSYRRAHTASVGQAFFNVGGFDLLDRCWLH